MHNFGDVFLFLLFGLSGLVAELFPRDSYTYKILKSNFPFLNSLIGRGVFYIVLGFVVMGDYTPRTTPAAANATVSSAHPILSDSDEPESGWSYFTAVSGVYISLVGAALVVTAYRSGRRSINSAQLSTPIVAFIPSIASPEVLERAPQTSVSFPTAV